MCGCVQLVNPFVLELVEGPYASSRLNVVLLDWLTERQVRYFPLHIRHSYFDPNTSSLVFVFIFAFEVASAFVFVCVCVFVLGVFAFVCMLDVFAFVFVVDVFAFVSACVSVWGNGDAALPDYGNAGGGILAPLVSLRSLSESVEAVLLL